MNSAFGNNGRKPFEKTHGGTVRVIKGAYAGQLLSLHSVTNHSYWVETLGGLMNIPLDYIEQPKVQARAASAARW
jgi:hypothetical protein